MSDQVVTQNESTTATVERKPRVAHPRFSDEEFKVLALNSKNLEELAVKTQLPKANASVRLNALRKKGIDVPRFSRKGKGVLVVSETPSTNAGEIVNGPESKSN